MQEKRTHPPITTFPHSHLCALTAAYPAFFDVTVLFGTAACDCACDWQHVSERSTLYLDVCWPLWVSFGGHI
jgi:hypothetical protein